MPRPSKPPGCRSSALDEKRRFAWKAALRPREILHRRCRRRMLRLSSAGMKLTGESRGAARGPRPRGGVAPGAARVSGWGRGDESGTRGHPRDARDLYDAFAEIHVEISEIRDLGDRLVAIGRTRARGKESGAETESPWGGVTSTRTAGRSDSDLPRPKRGPRSRRAVGVGHVP